MKQTLFFLNSLFSLPVFLAIVLLLVSTYLQEVHGQACSGLTVTPIASPNPVCSGSPVNLGATIPGTIQVTYTSSNVAAIQIEDLTTVSNTITIPANALPDGTTVVSVQLNGLTHTAPDDLDIMLTHDIGTGTDERIIIMSDAGGADDVFGLNLSFTDAGIDVPDENLLPNITTYNPTNYIEVANPDVYPNGSENTTTLASFTQANMNAVWQLHIIDDEVNDAGSLTSWSITFNVPTSALTTTYSWVADPTTIINNANTANATSSPTQTTTYTVSASVFGGACSAINNVQVTTITPPTVNDPQDVVVCAGATVSAITFTGTGTTFNWTNDLTTIGLLANGTGTISSFTATNNTALPLVATITVRPELNGCFGAPETFTITVNPSPTITIAAPTPNTACIAPFTGTVAVNSPVGVGITYLWDTGATTVNLASANGGNYTVTVADANNCTNTASTTINNIPILPTASATANNNTSCTSPNGSITLTSNGTNFIWSNGNTTQNQSGLTGGTYTVTVTGANACTNTASAIVSSPAPPTATPTPSNNTNCAAPFNGSITLTSNGTSFLWSNGSTAQSPSALNGGTYTVTITDTNGCVTATTATVNNSLTVPTASATTSNNTSCTSPNGSITLTSTGTSFLWSNGSTTQNQSSLTGGTYTVTVTGANACSNTASATVNSTLTPPTATTTANNNTSCTSPNGSVTLTSNGTNFIWSNGSTTQNQSGLTGGTYTVTVTGANACTNTASATVNNSATIPTVTVGIPTANSTCGVPFTGATNISITGATSPTFDWDNDGAETSDNDSQNLSAVNGGTYTVTVTSSNGCTVTASTTVNNSASIPSITVGAITANTACTANFTGGIAINVSNATTPSFNWSNGTTNSNLSNVNGGAYTVTVTSSNGCTATAGATISNTPSNPDANAGTDVTTTCTDPNAVIGAPAVVGSTYTWFPTTGLFPINASNPTANPASTTTYTVTVTGSNGCTASDAVTVTVDETPPVASIQPTGTVELCSNDPDGLALTAFPAGLSYQWAASGGGAIQGASNTQGITATAAGTYHVAVTASNGCTHTAQQVIANHVAPTVNIQSLSGSFSYCNNGESMLLQTATTPATGLTYIWSNGATESAITINPTTNTTFGVTVTDGTCQGSAAQLITVVEPPNAGADNSVTVCDINSEGNTTQDLDELLSAGVSSGVFSPVGGAPALQAGNVFNGNGVAIGTYQYNYTLNGSGACTTSDIAIISITVNDCASCPVPPNADFSYPSNPYCGGSGSATVQLAANAQNGTYTISPSSNTAINANTGVVNLNSTAFGNYTVTNTIAAANGCPQVIATASLIISEPFTFSATPTNASCGQNNGSVNVQITAGTSPTFAWSTNAITEDISDLAAGPYTVTITAGGCNAVTTVTVGSIGAPSLSLTVTNPACGQSTGSINLTVTPSGGATFLWSNGTTSEDLISIGAGDYTVTVTANGCTAITSASVQNADAPTANAGTDQTLTCTTPSVQIGTTGVGGNSYAWSPTTGLTGANTATPTTNVTSTTTYTVTVTNTASGCTATDAVVVTVNKTPPIADAGNNQTLTCTTTSVQIGTPTVSGNIYTWTPTSGLNNPTAAQPTATAANTYTVVVTGSNGCTASDAVAVSNNNNPPTANAGNTQQITCAQTSVTIGASAQVGNTYLWSNGNTNAQQSVSAAGTYTVTVTGSNGCTASSSVPVTGATGIATANAGSDVSLPCGGGTVQIGTAAIGGQSYSWSPATGLSATNIAQPIASQAGTYTVTVTNTSSGCTATDAVLVSAGSTPSAEAGNAITTTCSVSSATIGSPAIAGNTYAWSPTTGLTGANTAQPNANPASTTTYTVLVTNGAGCTATDAVTVTVNETAPIANAGTDQNLGCGGGSVTIGTSSLNNHTYLWSPATGLSATSIAQPTASQAGTYTVTVTNLANGCTATDAVVVSGTGTAPTANAGADATTTCTTSTATIGTPTVAGNTYAWSPASGLSATNIAQPNANPTSTTTYTVTVTGSNGCTATDAVTVTVNETAPTANAGADATTTCTTSTATIGTPTVAGNTYAWSPTTGLTGANTAQPSANPASTTTYTVTVTGSNGCMATDAVTVTVNETAPTANAGADATTTCTTPNTTIGTASVAGNTYAWLPAIGLTGANTAQPSANPASTTTYTVTVTGSNGCTATDAVTVAVNETPPTITNPPSNSSFCAGASVDIADFVSNPPGATFSWTNSNPGIGLAANGNGNLPVFTASNATDLPISATISVTVALGSCTGTAQTFTITVNPSPNIQTPAVSSASCGQNNGSIDLTVTNAAGNTTYLWSNNATSQDISSLSAGNYFVTVSTGSCSATAQATVGQTGNVPIISSLSQNGATCGNANGSVSMTVSNAPNATYSWSNGATSEDLNNVVAGTYTVTVTANSCQAIASITVSDTPIPSFTSLSGTATTCGQNNGTIQVSGTGGTGILQYALCSGTGCTNFGTAQSDDTFSGLATGTYTIRVSDGNNCSTTNTVVVGPSTALQAGITTPSGNFSICSGNSLSLTASPAGLSYLWSTGASAASISVNPITTQTFAVTVTNAQGCSAVANRQVVVNSLPDAQIGGSTSFCAGGSTTLSATPSGTGFTYQWSNGANTETVTANTNGTFTVTVTNTNGCSDASPPVTVSQQAQLTPNVTGDNTICAGQSTIFDAGAGFSTYLWNTSSTNQTITATTAGTYTVTVTQSACSGTGSISLTVNNNPSPDITSLEGFSTCDGNISLEVGNFNSYQWQFDGSSIAGDNVVNATQTGTYTVTVTDSNGCINSDTQDVTVNIAPTVSFIDPPSTICGNVGQFVISAFVVPSTGNYTYLWNDGSTGSSYSPVIENANDTESFSVIVTDDNDCSATSSVSVNVLAVPDTLLEKVVLNKDPGDCPTGFDFNENNISLDEIVNTNGVSGGTWSVQGSPQGVLLDEFNNILIALPNATVGDYELTYSTNGECAVAFTIPLQILSCNCPTIIPDIADDWCLDVEEGINLDYFLPTGGGALVFNSLSVTGPTGAVSVSPTSTATETSDTLALNLAGNYTVTYSFTAVDADGACPTDIQGSKGFTVHALPSISIISDADTVCADTPATFLASPGFGNNYTWLVNNNLQNGINSATLPNVSLPAPSANISVSVIDLNGCSNEAAKDVAVILRQDLLRQVDIPLSNCDSTFNLNGYLSTNILQIAGTGVWTSNISGLVSANGVANFGLLPVNTPVTLQYTTDTPTACSPESELYSFVIQGCNLDCATPSIIQKDNSNSIPNIPILICSIENAVSYEWFAQGHSLPGTLNQQFYVRDTVWENGKHPLIYGVNVVAPNCPEQTDTISVGKVDFVPNFGGATQVALSPNPNNGNFGLQVYDKAGLVQMTVYDLVGRQVGYLTAEKPLGLWETGIDVSYLPQGVYFLSVRVAEREAVILKFTLF